MAREAAARGAAMLQQQPYNPDRRFAPPTKAADGLTPKITGHAPVLPARRKAEFARWREEQEQQQRRQQRRNGEFIEEEEDAPPPRTPNSQREYDATVAALRKELASTEIHMATLQARQQNLMKRLAEMGEAF